MIHSPTEVTNVNVKVGQIRNVIVSALVLIIVIGLIALLIYSVNKYLEQMMILRILFGEI